MKRHLIMRYFCLVTILYLICAVCIYTKSGEFTADIQNDDYLFEEGVYQKPVASVTTSSSQNSANLAQNDKNYLHIAKTITKSEDHSNSLFSVNPLDAAIKKSVENVKRKLQPLLEKYGNDTKLALRRFVDSIKSKERSDKMAKLPETGRVSGNVVNGKEAVLHFLRSKNNSNIARMYEGIEFNNERRMVTRAKIPLPTGKFKELFRGVYLYSAYYDYRSEVHHIRLIVLGESNKRIKTKLWCHFPTTENGRKSLSTAVQFYETCENHMKHFSAYLGSCIVPKDNVGANQISLSKYSAELGTSYIVNVTHNKPQEDIQQQIGICVPPLFGQVSARALMEFIEMSMILGAQHFTFYHEEIQKEALELLKHYQNIGLVTLLPWEMPLENYQIWYHGQSAAIWDCQYRNMYKSKLLFFIDIDEYLFPKNYSTWSELVDYLHEANAYLEIENIAVYRFYSVFFDSEFQDRVTNKPRKLHHLVTLDNTIRTQRVSKIRTKMLVNPTKVFELGIHHLSKPFEEHFQTLMVPSSEALIHHHRKCDWNFGMDCEATEKDDSILRYQDELLSRIENRIIEIKDISDEKLNVTSAG